MKNKHIATPSLKSQRLKGVRDILCIGLSSLRLNQGHRQASGGLFVIRFILVFFYWQSRSFCLNRVPAEWKDGMWTAKKPVIIAALDNQMIECFNWDLWAPRLSYTPSCARKYMHWRMSLLRAVFHTCTGMTKGFILRTRGGMLTHMLGVF